VAGDLPTNQRPLIISNKNLRNEDRHKTKMSSSSPPRRMTRARAKKEGYELDVKINPQWKTPRKPKSKSTTKFIMPQDSTSSLSESARSIVPGGAQRIPSPVKIHIVPRLPPQPVPKNPTDRQAPQTQQTVSAVSNPDKSPHKQSVLGSPIRVRPRTQISKAVNFDKENSPASAVFSGWTKSGKSAVPKTPRPTSASRPLEASPSSINTHPHPATVKVLTSPIRVLVPPTPSHPLGSPRRIPTKAEKMKNAVGKMDPIRGREISSQIKPRPQSPLKSSNRSAKLPTNNRAVPWKPASPTNAALFGASTLTDIDSPVTTTWVPLKTIPNLQRPQTQFPPARPLKGPSENTPPTNATKEDFFIDGIIQSTQKAPSSKPIPKFPIRPKSTAQSPSPERLTPLPSSRPLHFDSLEDLKPINKTNKWKTPMKGPIHPPQSIRKVCFRTPSTETSPYERKSPSHVRSRPQSILCLATPKRENTEEMSTTPIHSPSSPKVFDLSDADDGFEMFTPRKARPMSMPVAPRAIDLEYQMTLPMQPKDIVVFEQPANQQGPVINKSPQKPMAKMTEPDLKATEPVYNVLKIPKGQARRDQSRDISVPIKDHHPTTPIPEPRPRTPSSSKTVKGPLNGVSAFVDVRTADGDDASAPFAETLKNLGARVVKQWTWNGEEIEKVGITHVIFKQGGPRTLSKVKMAKGAVKCVGLGWISRYHVSMLRG